MMFSPARFALQAVAIGEAALLPVWQCRKPAWWPGRLFLRSMNLSHSGLTKWGLSYGSIQPSDVVLDVGCGGGSYLYRLKQWGWETYGVEPSETGAKQAKSLGLAVHHGSLEKARFPDSFFDAVRLSNVLEHLSDPKATLQEVSRILKLDGLVYITVPNTRSFVFWLFQDNWYALDSPRHVICYCPRTLQFLCDATGFEIADISFKAGPFNFVRSVEYYFEEKGRRWPAWFREIQWERSKFIRRALKPFFFAVDSLGYGDFLHATLQKKTN